MVDARAVVVAKRAAEQAAAAGVDLPEDLALWALAGGRPEAAAVPGAPEELGDLLEATLTPSQRQNQGAHYTPGGLAAELVERALAVAGRGSLVVGDPACGGGALLLAACRRLADAGEPPAAVVDRVWGVDLDPVAAATTEVALALWAGVAPPRGHISVGDALHDDLGWPPIDLVIGNPPFLSQLGASTVRAASEASRLRARYGSALRAYTDTAWLFLLRACELAAGRGVVALLQPLSILGARDAAGVRRSVVEQSRLVDLWFPPSGAFDAAVDVCVPILRMGEPDGETGWSAHLARRNGVPVVALADGGVVGDEGTVTAAFRSEYYGTVDHVHEHRDLPSGRPVATTGLVDLGRCAWGTRPARIGGRAWDRPVVDVVALEGRAADWARRTAGPKLLVASQTKVVEVVVDEEGAWLPGVPLVVVVAPPERLWALAAALAAPAVSAWLLERSAGTALTPSALKVTASLLRAVPLPSDVSAWEQGTNAFRSGDLLGFVDAMGRAYDVGPEVGTWWTGRANNVWSHGEPHR